MGLGSAAKKRVPKWLKPWAKGVYYPFYRLVIRLWCRAHALRDSVTDASPADMPVPPPMLRFKVGGTPSRDSFLDTGRRCAESLLRVMQQGGSPFPESGSEDVLDFGCGCGRTLVWLARKFPGLRYSGTDTDPQMISWCRLNLAFADFRVNGPMPPLAFPAGKFDRIYAISVFTHLDERTQLAWLQELERVLKPGGFLCLTVHGDAVWQDLAPGHREAVRQAGTLTLTSRKLEGFFPDWYQTTFHSRDYIESTCSKYFELVRTVPEGMGYFDVVICKKSSR